MHITNRGQVTIPRKYREQFGLLPQTDVNFIIKNNQLCLEKTDVCTRGKFIIDNLRGTASVKKTTDEIMELTRGDK